MKAIEILMEEHRWIEAVLTCLEKMADELEAKGRLAAQDARRALEFFRVVADQCHHGKEEARLFPVLEAAGVPREGGPIGVMLYEHTLGRAHVRAMNESLEGAAAGEADARAKFLAAAREYIALLRAHIEKEDHCLFAMAARALGPRDNEALLREYETFEAREMAPGARDACYAAARELTARHGVPVALSPAIPAPMECHGTCVRQRE